MIQKPFRGVQLNKTHPFSKGLVGCWLFNEATGETVFDSSDNNNSGTLENGVAWGDSGLEFDGINNYILVPDNESTDITSGTISIIVKFLANESWNDELIAKSSSDTSARILYGIVEHGTWKAVVASGSASKTVIFSSYNLNQWYRLSFTFKNLGATTEIKTYVNGVFQNSDTADFIVGSDATWGYTRSDNHIGIGAHGAGTSPVNCSIKSVNIHNRVLSAEEIAWSYREPYAMFEPAFNPALLYSAAPPVGAIMNQFQRTNIGADLYNGVFA